MIAIFWNCRGLGHASTIRVLQELCNSHRPTLLFLSETKLCNSLQIQSIAHALKFDNSFSVPANGSSGGLAMIWKQELDVQIITSSPNFISLVVLNDPVDQPWFLTVVYGPTIPIFKPTFWDELRRIGDTVNGPWCMVGDFNVILEQREKIGGRPFTSGSQCLFRRFIDDAELLDMGYFGNPFTWNNQRAGNANIQERLDRGLSNTLWRLMFPQATIHHLPAFRSDHKPLLMYTFSSPPNRPKPFRFEEMWVRDATCGAVISKAWQNSVIQYDINQFMTRLETTKIALKAWNRHHFGHLQSKATELKKYIAKIQTLPQTNHALEMEGAAQLELDEIWNQERLL